MRWLPSSVRHPSSVVRPMVISQKLEGHSVPVSRSNGQSSGLEAGRGIPCRRHTACYCYQNFDVDGDKRCICDAGSEKTKTDVTTTHGQMIESNNINRSLLVLGMTTTVLHSSA